MTSRALKKAQAAIGKAQARRDDLAAQLAEAEAEADRVRSLVGPALVDGGNVDDLAAQLRQVEAKRDALASGVSAADMQLTAARVVLDDLKKADDMRQVDDLAARFDGAFRQLQDNLADVDPAALETLAFQSYDLAARHGNSQRKSVARARRQAAGQLRADLLRLRHTVDQWLKVSGS